jgi:FdhE protein
MTQDVWLSSHPYLQPVAELHKLVGTAAVEIPTAGTPAFDWDRYLSDFHRGVPLLHSSAGAIDLTPVQKILESLLEKLTSTLPEELAPQMRTLVEEMRLQANAQRRVMDWLLGSGTFQSACPGLLRFLGWTALARHLSPVLNVFAAWREEEQWLRTYCPTCGSLPAMAQLVGVDPGRRRFLSCGLCRTRWWYRRTQCPFCENQNDHRLAVLAVEGEGGLRIDYCESCRAYLKTYDGEGSENVLLADWTSIHLDVIASDHGLKRLTASLYEL